MSTQHPDNVTTPFFAENSVLSGDDEIREAYYHFAHLGIKEQMWDAEGKEVDNFVVKKLLNKYGYFFSNNKLGKDVFLTLRVPNPAEERNEAKILVESLQSIPRSFDTAQQFYGDDIAPIFEVILPMTTHADQLQCVHDYYKKYVVGLQDKSVGNTTVQEWIGSYSPSSINVIPLVENKESMMNIKQILQDYISDKSLPYQRVFLARSDPALNYGWLSGVLLNKWALSELYDIEQETGIPLYPIIGVGSSPFRGNFRPDNINCLHGYPSNQTFSIQSAFKYDFPPKMVQHAVEKINETSRGKPVHVEREPLVELFNRYAAMYTDQLKMVAPWIQKVSKYVPRRRKRKLHVGLFGYSRGVSGFRLPRAIGFCASLYSLGLPPELLGLNAVKEKNIDYLQNSFYGNVTGDLKDALQFVNVDTIKIISPTLAQHAKDALNRFHVEVNKEHKQATTDIVHAVGSDNYHEMKQHVAKAAHVRHFLG
jgi:phosphoenolpyruvate carboxylase